MNPWQVVLGVLATLTFASGAVIIAGVNVLPTSAGPGIIGVGAILTVVWLSVNAVCLEIRRLRSRDLTKDA